MTENDIGMIPEQKESKFECHIVYGDHEPSEEAKEEMEKIATLLKDFVNKKRFCLIEERMDEIENE